MNRIIRCEDSMLSSVVGGANDIGNDHVFIDFQPYAERIPVGAELVNTQAVEAVSGSGAPAVYLL